MSKDTQGSGRSPRQTKKNSLRLLVGTKQQLPAINRPIDPADVFDASLMEQLDTYYSIGLRCPGGHWTFPIDRAGLDQYNRDPDGYAAKYLGFADVDEYREWIELDGAALCGAYTKAGRLCRNFASALQLDPVKWRRLHRNAVCAVHGGRIPDETPAPDAPPPPPVA